MKIVASDFDGTLFLEGKVVSESDLNAISRWRAAGNKFGIATGRGLSLIMKRLSQFNVPFDFLVCTNGAAIFDNNLKTISSHPMKIDIIHVLLKEPIIKKSHYSLFFTTREALIYRPYEEFRDDLKELEIPEIDFEYIFKLENVLQVSLLYSTIEETIKARDILKDRFEGILQINRNKCFIDITVEGIDKGIGLSEMLKVFDWKENSLFTIGDDENDLPMIEKFNGYTVPSAMIEVKKRAIKIYNSVGELLDNQI